MFIRSLTLVMSTVLVLGVASTASAQSTATNTPTFELSAGYQFLRVPDQNFPFGLAIDGARHFGSLGLVGEAGWGRASEDEFGVEVNTNMFHLAAGPRWSGFGAGRVWPYAQVLAGVAMARSDLEVANVEVDDSANAFLLQPGIGATFVAGDGWGVFGQLDYRRTFFDEVDDVEDSINNQFRIYFGFRMILD